MQLFRFSILALLLLFPLRSQRPKGDRSKAARVGRPNLSLNPCVRCGRDSDMACPLTDPLEELIAALEAEDFEPCFDAIDARAARDVMSCCTNCGARGRFAYVGMKRDGVYRAFWSCEACGHWIEV